MSDIRELPCVATSLAITSLGLKSVTVVLTHAAGSLLQLEGYYLKVRGSLFRRIDSRTEASAISALAWDCKQVGCESVVPAHLTYATQIKTWTHTAHPVSHTMSKKQRNKKPTVARERPVEQIEGTQKRIGLKTMATIVSLVQSPPPLVWSLYQSIVLNS